MTRREIKMLAIALGKTRPAQSADPAKFEEFHDRMSQWQTDVHHIAAAICRDPNFNTDDFMAVMNRG